MNLQTKTAVALLTGLVDFSVILLNRFIICICIIYGLAKLRNEDDASFNRNVALKLLTWQFSYFANMHIIEIQMVEDLLFFPI